MNETQKDIIFYEIPSAARNPYCDDNAMGEV